MACFGARALPGGFLDKGVHGGEVGIRKCHQGVRILQDSEKVDVLVRRLDVRAREVQQDAGTRAASGRKAVA